ncbi:MAG: hypothetical protein L3K02_04490, partial [Thermoplasmata archaeon]|nr:hypothetical protein [Thermoplasmata archaeon]
MIVLMLLSGLPISALSSPSANGLRTDDGGAIPPVNVTATDSVSVQNSTVGNLSNFWGAGVRPEVSLDNATNETAPTPLSWYEWPAGAIADAYNMTSGTLWTGGYASAVMTNESNFVRWCKSVACNAILSLPGEIDDPTLAAYEVYYTVDRLNFTPAYWEVGNEPYLWKHFGENWSTWSPTDNSPVTAAVYAQVVQSYISAIRNV